ncbi:MAG: prepilin peptidase, partial [Firmicutes bacterium]|nr:prepilin peptidase [Bacillota bacterium]
MLGSYLGTGALRWGEGKSNVGPPSHCPACGHRLGPADLV